MHRLTKKEEELLQQFFTLAAKYTETMLPIERSLEDLMSEANIMSLNTYARLTYVCKHYAIPDLHAYNMAAIEAAIQPLTSTTEYYRLFVKEHAHKYNGFIPLHARTYLEQKKVDDSADILQKHIDTLKGLFKGYEPFDEGVKDAEHQVATLRKVVITHTDPATGHKHRGRDINPNDDHTEASSVGMHHFLMTSEKKS